MGTEQVREMRSEQRQGMSSNSTIEYEHIDKNAEIELEERKRVRAK